MTEKINSKTGNSRPTDERISGNRVNRSPRAIPSAPYTDVLYDRAMEQIQYLKWEIAQIDSTHGRTMLSGFAGFLGGLTKKESRPSGPSQWEMNNDTEYMTWKEGLNRQSRIPVKAGHETRTPRIEDSNEFEKEAAIRERPMKGKRGKIPNALEERIYRKCDNVCQANYMIDPSLDRYSGEICGSNEFLQLDHIVPVAEGGKSTFRNLQLLCQRHNGMKSDKVPQLGPSGRQKK